MCIKELGCEAFIDFRECKDIAAEVMRLTGRGAHAMIVTGGTKASYEGWATLLRVGGTLVCVGLRWYCSCIRESDIIALSHFSSSSQGNDIRWSRSHCTVSISVW
jgi:D-arabinose 1-dehydrogenase-like Zn-dependent alcohol dehydrogenase